jgi:hypothetical protein
VQDKAGLRQEKCSRCGLWKFPQELSGPACLKCAAGVPGLRAALDEAARALFAIKRMKPDAVPEFAAEAHRKACVALDAAGVPGPQSPRDPVDWLVPKEQRAYGVAPTGEAQRLAMEACRLLCAAAVVQKNPDKVVCPPAFVVAVRAAMLALLADGVIPTRDTSRKRGAPWLPPLAWHRLFRAALPASRTTSVAPMA